MDQVPEPLLPPNGVIRTDPVDPIAVKVPLSSMLHTTMGRLVGLTAALMFIIGAVFAGWAVHQIDETKKPPPPFAPFAPMQPYPIVDQANPANVMIPTSPSFTPGQDVASRVTRCNTTKQVITVTGHPIWQEQQPPGFAYDSGGTKVGQYQPGCTQSVISIPIPRPVIDRAEQQALLTGQHSTTWAITGTATAHDPKTGRPGYAAPWTTVNFQIVVP